MDIQPILPQYIDSTMISAFRQCPRKFYYEFILGLRPTALSIDLHAGGCFATAIETISQLVYTENKPLEYALPIAYGIFLKEWGDVIPNKDTPKTRDRVWEAVEEYYRTYPPLTDHLKPLRMNGASAYEFTFAIPLDDPDFPLHPETGDPFLYSGRFDMLASHRGTPVIRDEKTTTSIGAKWADQWNLRSQFIGYCWACQKSGLPVDTVHVRGVGILKTKFHMPEIAKTYSQYKIDLWYSQLRRDLIRIADSWKSGEWDYNLADACTSYGGCPFVDLCSSPFAERYYGQFEVRRWNPIRRNPVAILEAA